MEEITVVSFVQSESPNITERLRLKRNLGCRNFHWYLTTVYPELYIPQDRPALSGEVAHTHTPHTVSVLLIDSHDRLTCPICAC